MKVLAFDLGGVLFSFDYAIALKRIENKIGAPKEKIIADLFHGNFGLDFEKGLSSSHDFYLKFKKSFSASLSYDEFTNAWCEIFFPQEEVINLVKRLSLKYPIYLISNINELHFDYLYQRHAQVFSLFKELILSFKVNSAKPERKIYEALGAAAETEFKNIIYIDDRQDLISTAKHFDLQCIQFMDYSQLVNDLKSLGVE